MTLRKKTIIIIGIAFSALILAIYLIAQVILMDSFVRLEENNARLNVSRVMSALEADIANLETLTSDWAAWDDTYAFVNDLDDAYIQSNLVDETFTNLSLNLLLVINSSNQVVFEKAFDLDSEAPIPVPASLNEHTGSGGLLLRHPDEYDSLSGIIILPEGPMLVSSSPILTKPG
ncbi:CHASE4 domain-containing protein [Chloroflexota bacterium]